MIASLAPGPTSLLPARLPPRRPGQDLSYHLCPLPPARIPFPAPARIVPAGLTWRKARAPNRHRLFFAHFRPPLLLPPLPIDRTQPLGCPLERGGRVLRFASCPTTNSAISWMPAGARQETRHTPPRRPPGALPHRSRSFPSHPRLPDGPLGEDAWEAHPSAMPAAPNGRPSGPPEGIGFLVARSHMPHHYFIRAFPRFSPALSAGDEGRDLRCLSPILSLRAAGGTEPGGTLQEGLTEQAPPEAPERIGSTLEGQQIIAQQV